MKAPKREPKLYKWTTQNGDEREWYDSGEPYEPVEYGTTIWEDVMLYALTGYCIWVTITAIL